MICRIDHAASQRQIQQVCRLFEEYIESLEFDLDFQNVDNDLTDPNVMYGPPDGCLLLALTAYEPVGCVGVKRFRGDICEMKRLYVRPQFRGHGIGRRLAEMIIDEARKIGYVCMRLDTLATMNEAMTLYRSLGFVEIEPYRLNPIKGAKFMELVL